MPESTRNTILIVDDEPAILEMLADYFQEDYECLSAESGAAAISAIRDRADIAAVVLDIKMMPIDGLEVARVIRSTRPNANILFHTAHSEYDEAQIDSTFHPFDYIRKGGSLPRLRRGVKNAVEAYRFRTEPAAQASHALTQYEMVGRSPKMLALFEKIRLAASSDLRVLIEGETGTGKELVAKAIHRSSRRCSGPWAVLQGYPRPAELTMSELFGHCQGAFTDARDRMGVFEYANGGTLFIDEVSNLDTRTQAHLLRAVETGEYQRVGSPQTSNCSVRIISATNKPLKPMIASGEFREDLYYRLREMVITVPPLRERREDIPLLVRYFVDRYIAEHDISPKHLEPAAIDLLMAHNFEGNVRDLRFCVESLVSSTVSDLILGSDVRHHLDSAACGSRDHDTTLASRLREYKRACVIEALDRNRGNVRQTAAFLGLDPANLSRMLKELEIPRRTAEPTD